MVHGRSVPSPHVDPEVLPGARDAQLHALVEAGPALTFATAAGFRRRMTDLVTRHEVNVIVDLRATEAVDAAGLGALVGARRRLSASQGCLHLIPSAAVEQQLARAGLLRFFDLAADPESAADHRPDRIPGPRPGDHR